MHPELADAIVESVRRRVGQGDCPTEPAHSVEMLEDCVLTLAHRLTVPRPSPTPATAGTPDETRWLIGWAVGGGPKWVARLEETSARFGGGVFQQMTVHHWTPVETTSVDEAMQFCRERDAVAFLESIAYPWRGILRIEEHLWTDAGRTDQPPPALDAIQTETNDDAAPDADVEFLLNYAAALSRRARQQRAAGYTMGPECSDIQVPIFERIANRIRAGKLPVGGAPLRDETPERETCPHCEGSVLAETGALTMEGYAITVDCACGDGSLAGYASHLERQLAALRAVSPSDETPATPVPEFDGTRDLLALAAKRLREHGEAPLNRHPGLCDCGQVAARLLVLRDHLGVVLPRVSKLYAENERLRAAVSLDPEDTKHAVG